MDSTANISAQQLSEVLPGQLRCWREAGVRCVWMKVALEHSDWIAVLAKHEFRYHHALSEFAMLIRWMDEKTPCMVPVYPFTSVGEQTVAHS